jgi:hypothetical protein
MNRRKPGQQSLTASAEKRTLVLEYLYIQHSKLPKAESLGAEYRVRWIWRALSQLPPAWRVS